MIIKESTFPLTPDECKLLFDELYHHTFSKHHPMYLYHGSLMNRMKSFIESHKDNMRICDATKG